MSKAEQIEALKTAAAAAEWPKLQELALGALNEYPEEGFGYDYLAQALDAQEGGSLEAIERCLLKLVELNPKDTKALLRLAQTQLKMGDAPQAMVAYRQILKLQPEQDEALNAIGEELLFEQNKAAEALSFFQAAMKVKPHELLYQINALLAMRSMGNREKEALVLLTKSIKLHGYQEKLFAVGAELYLAEGEKKKALKLLQMLREKDPNLTYVYNVGRIANELEDYPLAYDALAQAYELAKANDEVSSVLLQAYAKAAMELGHAQKAQELIEQGIQISPSVSANLLLLDSLLAQGKLEEVEKEMEVLLRQYPLGSTFGLDVILKQGRLLQAKGDYAAAETLYLDLMKAEGGQKDAATALGLMAIQQENNPAKAYFYLSKAEALGAPRASQLIKEHLYDYLKGYAEQTLADMAPAIEQNKNQAVFQQLAGKYLSFKAVRSESMRQINKEVADMIEEQLKKRIIFFSPQAGFSINPIGQTTVFAYELKVQHSPNMLDFELRPLDGRPRLGVRLNMSPQGLVWSEKRGEFLLFELKDWSELSEEQQAHVQESLAKVAYLPDAIPQH